MPSADQLSRKRVDPLQLEAHVRRKMSKEERLAMVPAGREDRGKYLAATAVGKKKTGGLSNKQKQHGKRMPLAATIAKAARSRQGEEAAAQALRESVQGPQGLEMRVACCPVAKILTSCFFMPKSMVL